MLDSPVNKVAESGLITLDLEDFMPREQIHLFDLKDFLFMGQVLKEKDYRAALQSQDWETYRDKTVAIWCSADAVIPTWAYMLAASYLQPVALRIGFGDPAELLEKDCLTNIAAMDPETYRNKKVVVKGCGDLSVPVSAYVEITRLLRPVVKSLMYGEPCSTVPLFKNK